MRQLGTFRYTDSFAIQGIGNVAVAFSHLGSGQNMGFFEARMGLTRTALLGYVCAFVAVATPAAAFSEIDPLTRQPLYGNDQAFQAQASPVPRETVSFDARYAPGTIIISTGE